MINICFFCRSRLTQLYGELHSYIKKEFNYSYVAYSSEEESQLKNDYGLTCAANLKSYIHLHYDQVSTDKMNDIDDFIIELTEGRFNLNSTIQSDRALKHLTQNEAYKLVKLYWMFWHDFFNENKNIDIFVHETTSLALNFIASLFCKRNKIIYTDMVGVPNSCPSFMFISSNNGESIDFDKDTEIEVDAYLNFNKYISQKYQSISNLSVDTSLAISIKSIVKNTAVRFINKFNKKIDRAKDCIEWFMLYDTRYKNKLLNLFLYNFIHWDEPVNEERYFYYSMNLEPEAVVQFLADGIYSNQIKLIENIASQLPPGYYLYVKDHVVEYGYRKYSDYKYLQSLHNVKVINPRVRGSELIKKCEAVIAICGTAILEAHFFDKFSYMFGNFYYEKSKNVAKVMNIRDFRALVYAKPKFDKTDKIHFLTKFLSSSYIGSPDYFSGGALNTTNDREFSDNITQISNALEKFALRNCKKVY